MRFKTMLFGLLTSSLSFSSFGQEQKALAFNLTADLSQLKVQPLKALITKTDLGGYGSTSDTYLIRAKKFQYEKKFPEPGMVELSMYWPGKKISSVSFWAVPGVYQLKINPGLRLELLKSDESEMGSQVMALKKEEQDCKLQLEDLLKNVSYEGRTVEMVEKRMDALRDSMALVIEEGIYKKFALRHLDSPVGLYALYIYGERPYGADRISTRADEILAILNQFKGPVGELPSAKKLRAKLALGKQLVAGKMLNDVSLPDTAGKLVKISDFKGKYVLLDFWASWCAPCRNESPVLIKAFHKYKDLGFQIVAISRDDLSLRKSWRDAIRNDKVTEWPQLSDFDNIAAESYDIKYLPSNYLIDPEGVIIGKDLRGEQLEAELEKIFKK